MGHLGKLGFHTDSLAGECRPKGRRYDPTGARQGAFRAPCGFLACCLPLTFALRRWLRTFGSKQVRNLERLLSGQVLPVVVGDHLSNLLDPLGGVRV